jgi:hypothetical protein
VSPKGGVPNFRVTYRISVLASGGSRDNTFRAMRIRKGRWRALGLGCVALTLAGVILATPFPVSAAGKSYVVRKSDTLSGIAQAHGVSINQLIEANSLSRSGHVRAGQVLKIPEPAPPAGASRSSRPTTPGLSQAFQRLLNRTRVTPGRWDYVVIHHSATPMGSVQGMDHYHRRRGMENGLAYHFVIGNGRGMGDGQIAIGRRWSSQLNGGHLASEALNARALGICLVGNFDQKPPSKQQLASLEALTRYLMKRCGIPKSAVKTHQQINTIGTRCPGRLFDDDAFLRALGRPS